MNETKHRKDTLVNLVTLYCHLQIRSLRSNDRRSNDHSAFRHRCFKSVF